MKVTWMAAILVGLSSVAVSSAEPVQITIDAARSGPAISPELFGLFLEDIDLSIDGGLYAELIRDRSFEEPAAEDARPVQPLPGSGMVAFPDPYAPYRTNATPFSPFWTPVAGSDGTPPALAPGEGWPKSEFNRRALRLAGSAGAGVFNTGYHGIALRAGETYTLRLFVRGHDGFDGSLKASLETPDASSLCEPALVRPTPEWREVTATFKVTRTVADARLKLTLDRAGAISLDFVSLMPDRTWKNHGLRPDLAQMLADLKPRFVRFPGGCWVEGDQLDDAYRWKQAIGPLHARRTQWNRWGYYSSNGIGYHEYLQFCEDLGAAGIFIINAGMSHEGNVPMEAMGPFVQDALDAVEYAIGPATSRWGGERARNGHPAPFPLKYLGIGNENGGPAYDARYALFHDALKKRYPDLPLIACLQRGSAPASRPLDWIDEHHYHTPEWFLNNGALYDRRARTGPKVFIGEYACTRGDIGYGNLRAAVSEAVFMTGLERNGDLVRLAAYAPLLAHVRHLRWKPDLIYFDGLRAYGTPSYFVQKMFAQNAGEVVLPARCAGAARPVSAVRATATGDVIVKLVNPSADATPVTITVEGLESLGAKARVTVLAGTDPAAENTLDQPLKVAPVESDVALDGHTLRWTAPAWSLTVLRVPPR